MTDNPQDKDKNLERYFDAKKQQAIPHEILADYTESLLQRLHARSSAWRLAALPALGLAMAAAVVFVFWYPRPSSAPLPAIKMESKEDHPLSVEEEARILMAVSADDLASGEPTPQELESLDDLETAGNTDLA